MLLQVNIQKKLANYTLEVRLDCRPGTLTAVVGPSGAGKSTLMRIISGLESPDGGFIRFGGQVWHDSIRKICLSPQKRRLGIVFQEYTLFPHLSIRKNIAFAAEDESFVDELMQQFSIAHIADCKPARVSGGERQRAAICQAIARRPVLLLLDEPFSALDVGTRTVLQEELKALVGRLQIPVLHITHDLNEAYYLADEIFVMENGKAAPQWLERQQHQQHAVQHPSLSIPRKYAGRQLLPGARQCVPSFS